jgi:hypothetical protein
LYHFLLKASGALLSETGAFVSGSLGMDRCFGNPLNFEAA